MAVVVAALALGCAPDRELDSDGRAADDSLPGPSSADALELGSTLPRVVLLISIDTLRADHLGIYGYPRPTSPVIDGLGREGVVFEDANSTSPWTLPAHASMLTGLYPNRHGAIGGGRRLHETIPTLATVLASRGYRTAAAVNSIRVGRLYGLSRGFQEFLYVEEVADRVSPSTWITDRGLEWMREFRDDRLFLFLHYFDVHSNYTSLPEHERRFVAPYDGKADGSAAQLFLFGLDPKLLDECRANPEQEACRTWARARIDPSVARIEFDEADRRHLIDLYDAGVRQMDAELGRLFDSLRREGLLDECLLILTSDHGEEFLDHGGVSHSHTQYQELLQVPLILRGPGIPAGTRVATPVTLVDVVPTVLAALGEQAPIEPDGFDLAPLWRGGVGSHDSDGESPFRERHLFAEADSRQGVSNVTRSIRRGRYKLHVNRLTGGTELYDLERDPGEQTDIAEREPAVVAALHEALLSRTGSAPQGETVELSSEDIEQLRSLGYLP
jgi:arylsulfatase A-like enzyme